jgi:asparagine synthetase B (glutamine-hydrolysing)
LDYYVTFAVSVLALRGYKQQQQPFLDEDGNILLYNGEIYEGFQQVNH